LRLFAARLLGIERGLFTGRCHQHGGCWACVDL